MMDTSTGLATISSLLLSLKALTGMAKDVNEVEFNGKIIEIQQKVLDIQAKYAELQQDNFTLQQTVTTLEGIIAKRDEMYFESGAYWTADSGPFCQFCWESEQKAIHLSQKLMGQDDYAPSNSDLVWYTCAFHTPMRVALPKNTSLYQRRHPKLLKPVTNS